MSETGNDGSTIFGLIILAVVGYGVWAGGSWAWDAIKGRPTTKASAPDQRDEQIKQLNARISQLESKPPEHHYELRNDGVRTFRFDPATGDTCIQLTTKEDWKNPTTIRQGCEYADFIAHGLYDPKASNEAECYLVGNKTSCAALSKQ